MLKLIIGVKGTGKTKTLINLVNGALEVTKGDVVCIEKGCKLRYDIKSSARLVDADEYMVCSAEALYGFIAGVLASNITKYNVLTEESVMLTMLLPTRTVERSLL